MSVCPSVRLSIRLPDCLTVQCIAPRAVQLAELKAIEGENQILRPHLVAYHQFFLSCKKDPKMAEAAACPHVQRLIQLLSAVSKGVGFTA